MLQILIYGAVSSAIYAMLAVGFTLIFGVARILNLAHGSFYALGAYAAYVLTSLLNFPLFIAAPLAVLLVAGFGVLMERFLVRPLRSSQLAVLMITLAVSLAVEQALFIIFGSEYRNVPSFVADKLSIGGVDIGGQRLLTLVMGVLVILLLWLFIQRTRLGAAILAVSQDPEAAQYMGIPTNRIFSIVMAISAGTAAFAGVMVSPFLTVQPTMGLLPMVKAFAIVIVGGLGSIPGSIIASLILGYSETIVAYLISTSWTELVSLVAVVITLMIRPSGILGRRAAF